MLLNLYIKNSKIKLKLLSIILLALSRGTLIGR